MPDKTLGLIYCLNRATQVIYCKNPVFKDEDADAVESYIKVLNPNDYMGNQPRFNDNYTKLAFIGTTSRFLTHSGNY